MVLNEGLALSICALFFNEMTDYANPIEPSGAGLSCSATTVAVVVPQLPSDATHRFEGVHVTTHESFEALAMSKLDVQFPAVTLD